MSETKAEQLAAKFRQMRELNEYGKASVQDVADELERLSPMEAQLAAANVMHHDEQLHSAQIGRGLDKALVRVKELEAQNLKLMDDLFLARAQLKEMEVEQEPVAWRWKYKFKNTGETGAYEYHSHEVACKLRLPCGEPLYTSPQTREGMCINGCKEACAYCLKHYGKP
jgi:hypothetical protein